MKKLLIFFTSFLFPICQIAFGQELLYKSDSTQIRVKVKEIGSKTISYTISGDSIERVYHVSKTVLDSLRLISGETINFTSGEWNDVKPIIKIPVNNVSIDLFNLALKNINVEYERVFKSGKFSLAAGLFYNVNYTVPNEYWYYDNALENYSYEAYKFFTMMGVNYFPFNHSLVITKRFRFSTGLLFLMGNLNTYDPINYNEMAKPVFHLIPAWKNKGRFYVNDHIQLNGGIDVSLSPFCAFICPQIGVSYGF